MTVHDITPFALDKNLGKAYNEAMSRIPEGDWACLRDQDTCHLLNNSGNVLHEYATRYPQAGILTCFTNRITTLSTMQLLSGGVDETTDIREHIKLAQLQTRHLYNTTPINRIISGFLMMISKATWNEVKFTESAKCLTVDNDYSRRIFAVGKQILRMDGYYLWHSYRLLTGIYDKSHLK